MSANAAISIVRNRAGAVAVAMTPSSGLIEDMETVGSTEATTCLSSDVMFTSPVVRIVRKVDSQGERHRPVDLIAGRSIDSGVLHIRDDPDDGRLIADAPPVLEFWHGEGLPNWIVVAEQMPRRRGAHDDYRRVLCVIGFGEEPTLQQTDSERAEVAGRARIRSTDEGSAGLVTHRAPAESRPRAYARRCARLGDLRYLRTRRQARGPQRPTERVAPAAHRPTVFRAAP